MDAETGTGEGGTMKRYEAYIFDLYGTLIDVHTDERKPAFWRALAAVFAEHGAHYEPKALQARYLELCRRETLRLCAENEATAEEAEIDLAPVFAALFEEKGVRAESTLIAQTAWRFRCLSTTHLRAYAGARELLLTLRRSGRSVFLLSNAQALFTRPELSLLGISDCFDGIYLSSDAGWRKPARRFMERLLLERALTPRQCLMIGNDPNADVAVARSVGMDSFYVVSATSPRVDPRDVPAVCVQPRIDLRRLQRTLLQTTP